MAAGLRECGEGGSRRQHRRPPSLLTLDNPTHQASAAEFHNQLGAALRPPPNHSCPCCFNPSVEACWKLLTRPCFLSLNFRLERSHSREGMGAAFRQESASRPASPLAWLCRTPPSTRHTERWEMASAALLLTLLASSSHSAAGAAGLTGPHAFNHTTPLSTHQ